MSQPHLLWISAPCFLPSPLPGISTGASLWANPVGSQRAEASFDAGAKFSLSQRAERRRQNRILVGLEENKQQNELGPWKTHMGSSAPRKFIMVQWDKQGLLEPEGAVPTPTAYSTVDTSGKFLNA